MVQLSCRHNYRFVVRSDKSLQELQYGICIDMSRESLRSLFACGQALVMQQPMVGIALQKASISLAKFPPGALIHFFFEVVSTKLSPARMRYHTAQSGNVCVSPAIRPPAGAPPKA